MKLEKLFEMQQKLRDHIVTNHQLEGQDLLPNMTLALQVELGELANAWRGFKHWSTDQEPRTKLVFEEYADCLSFILEIGLDISKKFDWILTAEYRPQRYYQKSKKWIVEQFKEVFKWTVYASYSYSDSEYYELVCQFLGLGEILGFSVEDIEEAYYKKNVINHERQEQGY